MQVFSRSKTIFFPISKVGRNYLPFIKELEDAEVKFINIEVSTIDYSGIGIVRTIDSDLYLSLEDRFGNLFYDTVPIRTFSSAYYLGQMQRIDRKIVLQNCFIENPSTEEIGSIVAISFFWDDSRFASKQQGKTYKETIELLLPPATQTVQTVKLKFPDIRTIAGKRIRSIRPAYYSTSISPLGYETINNYNIYDPTQYYSIYLTLANGSTILIDSFDVSKMIDINKTEPLYFENILINFPDSYITVVIKFGESGPFQEIRSIPLIIEYLED